MNTTSFTLLILLNASLAFGQSSRTVPLKSSEKIKTILFDHLIATKQAYEADERAALYQVDLLKKSHMPNVGVYKFGLLSPHASYNVAFVYPNKVVFPTATTTKNLFTLWNGFITKYPNSFSPSERKAMIKRLSDVVEHEKQLQKEDF